MNSNLSRWIQLGRRRNLPFLRQPLPISTPWSPNSLRTLNRGIEWSSECRMCTIWICAVARASLYPLLLFLIDCSRMIFCLYSILLISIILHLLMVRTYRWDSTESTLDLGITLDSTFGGVYDVVDSTLEWCERSMTYNAQRVSFIFWISFCRAELDFSLSTGLFASLTLRPACVWLPLAFRLSLFR